MAETTSSSAAGRARQELILTRIVGFLDRGTTTEVVRRALFPTAPACEFALRGRRKERAHDDLGRGAPIEKAHGSL